LRHGRGVSLRAKAVTTEASSPSALLQALPLTVGTGIAAAIVGVASAECDGGGGASEDNRGQRSRLVTGYLQQEERRLTRVLELPQSRCPSHLWHASYCGGVSGWADGALRWRGSLAQPQMSAAEQSSDFKDSSEDVMMVQAPQR
jgi:hypothetical protein